MVSRSVGSTPGTQSTSLRPFHSWKHLKNPPTQKTVLLSFSANTAHSVFGGNIIIQILGMPGSREGVTNNLDKYDDFFCYSLSTEPQGLLEGMTA